MLSKILSKSDCASCRFCCSFRKSSLWETPIFTKENIDAINNDPKSNAGSLKTFSYFDQIYAGYDLYNDYLTDDPSEEVKCPYLSSSGCILDQDEKPWDCKIWPLRVMRKNDGTIVIALTPTCPSINKQPLTRISDLTNTELSDQLFEYANEHPYLIKEYHEGFPILSIYRSPK